MTAAPLTEAGWVTIKAERAFYVDEGRDKILCDRGHGGPVTLVLKNPVVTAPEIYRQDGIQPTEAIAEEGEIDHVHGIPYRVGSIKHKPAAPLCTCTPQFGQDPYCPEHSHYDPQPTEAIAEDGEAEIFMQEHPGTKIHQAPTPRPDAIEGLVEAANDFTSSDHRAENLIGRLADELTRLSGEVERWKGIALRWKKQRDEAHEERSNGVTALAKSQEALTEAQSQLAACRDLLRRAQAALITKRDQARKDAP